MHVYWLLNGVPVQDTERRFAQGSSLSFAAVDRLQDSGAFQCVARDNVTGEEARSANASFNIKCERLRREGTVPGASVSLSNRGQETFCLGFPFPFLCCGSDLGSLPC